MKHWCTCRICGDSFASTAATADDCGKDDAEHRAVRESE